MHTYSNNKYIYSVDLMIAYVRLSSITSNGRVQRGRLLVKDLVEQLKFKGWEDAYGKRYSAMDVINTPTNYKQDYLRIKEANLKYPIICLSDGTVVDGIHRFSID